MADRTFTYCPTCEKQSQTQVELIRGVPELHLWKCPMGHTFTPDQAMAMGATMIKLEVQEKPAPTDVKATVWVNPELWAKFVTKFPERKNATMTSIMALSLDDDLIIISGEQAKKLKAMNIKTGSDMVVCAENNRKLEGENADLVRDLNRFYTAVRSNMEEATV